MKTILVFLLGAVVGAFAYNLYQTRNLSAATPGTVVATPNPSATAVEPRTGEWDLRPEVIKRELAETGQVARVKARQAGERIADAKIVTMIKAKYVLDRDLSALDINVDSRDGNVSLAGTVATAELVAKAVALALDTEGVTNVVAKLAVK